MDHSHTGSLCTYMYMRRKSTHACVHAGTYPIVSVLQELSLDRFSWVCARDGGRGKISSHLHHRHTTVVRMPIAIFGIDVITHTCTHTQRNTTEIHVHVHKYGHM